MTDSKEEIQYDIYQPFGPSILKVKMPQGYVNLLNAQADEILHDEKLSRERDWSHNLAGNVKKEISIDHGAIEGLPEFLATSYPTLSPQILSQNHLCSVL